MINQLIKRIWSRIQVILIDLSGQSIDYCHPYRLYQMSSEIQQKTELEEREDERLRKAAVEEDEVEVEDVSDHGMLGKRRRSVFKLLAWDIGFESSTHRGFNREKDGIPQGFYIHPRDRFLSYVLSLSLSL